MQNTGTEKLKFALRLSVAVAVFGSVISLGAVSYSTVHHLMARAGIQNDERDIRHKLEDGRDLFTPVEQIIERREALIEKLQDPVAIKEEQRKLAKQYQLLGQKKLASKAFTIAESAFQKAQLLDPENPVYPVNLAQLYSSVAANQEPDQKIGLLENAVTHWQEAAGLERDVDMRRNYTESAATTTLQIAHEFKAVGQPDRAKQACSKARSLAPPGSQIILKIERLLSQVR